MSAQILPFRRRGQASRPKPAEPIAVTVTVDGVVVASEQVTPGGALLTEVVALDGGDWTVYLGRGPAKDVGHPDEAEPT